MDDNWDQPICLFLCGDVMTGRGIDQVLPFPVHPVLYETSVRDAHKYVQLAEALHGPIPRPASFEYIWGDALEEIRPLKTDGRIINMETSVTTSEEYWPNKHVLYRMCPENVGCITAAHIDSCCLANNHVLDWGYRGLDKALSDSRLRRHRAQVPVEMRQRPRLRLCSMSQARGECSFSRSARLRAASPGSGALPSFGRA